MSAYHRTCWLAALLLASTAAVAHAGPCESWPSPKGKLIGKDGHKSRNISGIACVQDSGFPRACLVVDDELQGAQRVTLRDGAIEAGPFVPLIHSQLDGKPLELDGEGVAYGEGFFYVTGSHGWPRHPKGGAKDPEVMARIAADSQVIRIAVDPTTGAPAKDGVTRSDRLHDLIWAEPRLRRFADRRLQRNGVTIEGLAVRGDRLLFGFRGPALQPDRAAVLAVSAAALFDGGDPHPSLFLLPLGAGRGIRDLAPYDDGFLVLAGPSADEDGTYSVFAWNGVSDRLKALGDLPSVEEDGTQIRAEAILPLDAQGSRLRVLVLFDGGKEGAPESCLVARP